MFCTISHGILRHTQRKSESERTYQFFRPHFLHHLSVSRVHSALSLAQAVLWCISRAERVTYANSSIDSSINADRKSEREEKKAPAKTNSFRWQLPSLAKRKTLYCDVRQSLHPTEWHRVERQRWRKRHETNVVQYFNSYRKILITNH